MDATRVKVAIVGSGFAGIGLAIRLLQRGARDFVLLERADDVGGVWRDNVYPGCAVDVRSYLYSFSFAPNPRWTHAFSRQPEILGYLRDVARRFDVTPRVRFGHDVQDAAWDEGARVWRVATSRGPVVADVLVSAVGGLSEPVVPPIDGAATFAGKTMHTARWDASYDLRGKRVAVVGTGASAIQLIPAIQPLVQQLSVYQRTPAWVIPRRDRAIPAWEHALYERFPLAQKLARAAIYGRNEMFLGVFKTKRGARLHRRLALAHLKAQVPDRALRKKLTPKYEIGCKRVLLSDDYLPAMTQPNVELITEAVASFGADTITGAAGTTRTIDCVVYATGFEVTNHPIGKRVRAGGVTLAQAWDGSMKAHVGTTVAGFPNLFLLLGPNTGLGHSSVVEMIEAQIEHVLGALALLDGGARAIEPRADAQAAFVADVDARMKDSVWSWGGCTSWYLDETGRNSTLWPSSIGAFRRRARFDASEYVAR